MAATVVRWGGSEVRRRALIEELERLTGLLQAAPGVVEAWAFGSVVDGTVHAGSDLDLLVVRETDEPPSQRIGTLLAELAPRVPLDVFVYSTAEAAVGGRFVDWARRYGRRLW